jgi:hypothetical protein
LIVDTGEMKARIAESLLDVLFNMPAMSAPLDAAKRLSQTAWKFSLRSTVPIQGACGSPPDPCRGAENSTSKESSCASYRGKKLLARST